MTYNVIIAYHKDIFPLFRVIDESSIKNLNTISELQWQESKIISWNTIHWLVVDTDKDGNIIKLIKNEVLSVE